MKPKVNIKYNKCIGTGYNARCKKLKKKRYTLSRVDC